MNKTINQYDTITAECRTLFKNKLDDYAPAWRILRLSSLTDQIYIKANRLRTLQQKKTQKVSDNQRSEFIGIYNYSAIALIQLSLGVVDKPDIDNTVALEQFDIQLQKAKELMLKKNHDYGEAWRDMRISSITDLILQKILRIKQIEDNDGKIKVSEGIDANYLDMMNYSIFALILMMTDKQSI